MRKLILLLLSSCVALSAQTYAGGTSGFDIGGGGHTTQASGTLTVPSGAFLLACVFGANISNTFSVADTGSTNTFTALTKHNRGDNALAGQCFYAKNAVAVTNDVFTATYSTATAYTSINVYLITGADTVSPVDVDFGGTGTSTSVTSNTFSTTFANEILLASMPGNGSGCPCSVGSGFTQAAATASGGGGYDAEYKNVTSIQTNITATYTLNTSNAWVIVGAAVKGTSTPANVKRRNAGMVMQ